MIGTALVRYPHDQLPNAAGLAGHIQKAYWASIRHRRFRGDLVFTVFITFLAPAFGRPPLPCLDS